MVDIGFKGLRAACKTWGAGRPIICLHAGASSGAQWDRVATVLARECLIIAPDLLGFGGTDPWPDAGALTHDLQASLAATAIEVHTDRPVSVIGHSYGGATALRLAVNRPRIVRSLVLIEPILSCLLREAGDPLFAESVMVAKAFIASVEDGRPEIGWQAFVDSRNGSGTWARLSAERRQRFLDQSRQTREAFISNLENPTTLSECRRIDVPTTVVCGGETTAPDRRTTEVLRDSIPGVRYAVIEGAGHMSPLTHPDEVARIVRGHLARDDASDAGTSVSVRS